MLVVNIHGVLILFVPQGIATSPHARRFGSPSARAPMRAEHDECPRAPGRHDKAARLRHREFARSGALLAWPSTQFTGDRACLTASQASYPHEHDSPPNVHRAVEIGLPEIVLFFRRHVLLISLATFATAVLGLAYLPSPRRSSPRQRTFSWTPARWRLSGRGNVFEELTFNNSAVESQVQILSSDGLAGAIVDRLNLVENPTFMAGAWDPVSAARGFFMSLAPGSTANIDASTARRSKAVGILQKNLSV